MTRFACRAALALAWLPGLAFAAPAEYFLPQVANGTFAGGRIQTTFLLFNPNRTDVLVELTLTRDDGSPLVATLPGLGSDSRFTIPLAAGATRILETDGAGPLAAGAARVSSPEPIGVSAIFSIRDPQGRFLTETGVGHSPPTARFSLPVDTTAGFNTGLALYNPQGSTVRATFRLLDPQGETVAGPVERTLEAGGHLAQFVARELFVEVTEVRGLLQVEAEGPLAALTLRQNAAPLSFTTLPVLAAEARQQSFYLPQVAAGRFPGGRIATTFLLFNPTDQAATVELSLTRDDGSPLVVTLPGYGTDDHFELVLAAGGSAFLQTESATELGVGAAAVEADAPIGVAGSSRSKTPTAGS